MDIVAIIQEHSLTVRCLPLKVIKHWSYQDGDEHKKYVDANGKPTRLNRSVVVEDFDLEHFQNTPPQEWDKDKTPEQRMEKYNKMFPKSRKYMREEKDVEHGGWWYVKETPNTDSTVRFDRKYDKFFAPTLAEAIQLYLNTQA